VHRAPWNLLLSAQPWRISELGELCALATPLDNDQSQEKEFCYKPPLCAATLPMFIEAPRNKKIRAMLKFGRDSNWPLKITFASVIDEKTSASITYPLEWEGFDGTAARVRAQFQMAALADPISEVPALTRNESTWVFALRKEGNSVRAVIFEQTE
jgi:hypothetical protein